MYTIGVQLHGLKQLERLEAELVSDVRRQLVALAEVQGATFDDYAPVTWLYSFPRGDREDPNAVVETVFQMAQLLQSRESQLSGFSVLVDYLPGDRFAAVNHIRSAMSLVAEDNLVWIGEGAALLLEGRLEFERRADVSGAFLVLGRGAATPSIHESVFELAASSEVVDAIVERLSPLAERFGSLLVTSEDETLVTVNLEAALSMLFPNDPAIGWVSAEPKPGSLIGSIASLFDPLNVHQTGFWLSKSEKAVWDGKLPLIDRLLAGSPTRGVPDHLVTDMVLALELYLLAYMRRCRDANAPAVVVCHQIDEWTKKSIEVLQRIHGRFAERVSEGSLAFLCTAASTASIGTVASMLSERLRLPSSGVARVKELLENAEGVEDVNWRRIGRVTGGSVDSIVHYLRDYRHWDGLDESKISLVTREDLAYRVAASLDSDVKEVLLAIAYVGALVDRRRFVEFAAGLGIDPPRVPTILDELARLGLIRMRSRLSVALPALADRVRVDIGRAAGSVHERVAISLIDAVREGSVSPSDEIMRFLLDHNSGRSIPALYHLRLGRLLDRRSLSRAQAYLYDAVPAVGFDAQARRAMQAVLNCNRLRLALLQRNMQAAGRLENASERIEASGTPVTGDLALERGRLAFMTRNARLAQALLKQAIVEYQEQDDEIGLARANLDFGIVLLAQENIHGAREYFRIATGIAEETTSVFEQMRALRYTLSCEFIHGNFSRVLDLADELSERANAAGMREVQLFAEFARGRTQFELGRYAPAVETFAQAKSVARTYGITAAAAIAERWLGRSLVYDDRFTRGLEVLDACDASAESLFFAAEAWLRIGDHGESLRALARAPELSDTRSDSPEAICWASGFASFEDLAIGALCGSTVLEHQVLALRGYVLAESGKLEEGIQEMYRLTREMRMSDADPFNRIYFYLYSLIIPESGESELEDASTVLGKAVRCIQERTSRMDQYADKTDFLRQNFWNTRLMRQAQIHNLV